MIKNYEENDKKMVAVVLGDEWSCDPEDYRKSLFEIIDACILNEEAFNNTWFTGKDLYNCLKLARALEQPHNQEGR